MDTELILKTGAEALQLEIDGLVYLKDHLGKEFAELVRLCIRILDNGGKIVVCGIGKSGHVGKKIAATLASTGSPSIFVHAVEAMHGDLGMLQELNRQGHTVILITHDNSIAMQAPRIIRLEDGRIVYDGDANSPEAFVSSPALEARLEKVFEKAEQAKEGGEG